MAIKKKSGRGAKSALPKRAGMSVTDVKKPAQRAKMHKRRAGTKAKANAGAPAAKPVSGKRVAKAAVVTGPAASSKGKTRRSARNADVVVEFPLLVKEQKGAVAGEKDLRRKGRGLKREGAEEAPASEPRLIPRESPSKPAGKGPIALGSPRRLAVNDGRTPKYPPVLPRQVQLQKAAESVVAAALSENRAPPAAVVLECSHFIPPEERRQCRTWTPDELRRLEQGVKQYGEGNWSRIWHDAELEFYRGPRTAIDLKDKWRNLHNYRPYSEHPLRSFIIVDANHRPMRNPSGQLRIFKNRWPRDAALKAASKDEMYPILNAQTNERAPTTSIYVRELLSLDQQPFDLSEPIKSDQNVLVHVYRASRERQAPPRNLAKFENYRQIWVASVAKESEELYIRTHKQ